MFIFLVNALSVISQEITDVLLLFIQSHGNELYYGLSVTTVVDVTERVFY